MHSYVIDDDKDIVINVTTRTIESDVLKNTKLIKGDHKSERITFNISRYIENKDLLDCDKIEIHYINMGSASNISKGVYTVTDASEVDSNTIRFSWLISMNATLYPGNLYFVIKFVNIDENNVIVYSWSTATNKDLIVGDSLNCDVVVDEEYLDILAQWESDITNNVINDVKKSITAKDVSYVGGMDNIPFYVENVDDALWELNRAITETRIIKQDLLVSGENVKTINGESILGRGDINISGGSGGDNYFLRRFITDLYQLEDFEQYVDKMHRDVLIVLSDLVINGTRLYPGDNLVRTGNYREYKKDFETSFDGLFTYIYVYGNEYKRISKVDSDALIFNFNDLINQMNIIYNNRDNIQDIQNILEFQVLNVLGDKVDNVNIENIEDPEETLLSFRFSSKYNTEIRAKELTSISLTFNNGVYKDDYTSGLSFDSGETPTAIDYTNSGILNWVGTDCAMSDGLSIFQPSPNTHYDIVFYFNGRQFIGLVNGFVPSIEWQGPLTEGNEAV